MRSKGGGRHLVGGSYRLKHFTTKERQTVNDPATVRHEVERYSVQVHVDVLRCEVLPRQPIGHVELAFAGERVAFFNLAFGSDGVFDTDLVWEGHGSTSVDRLNVRAVIMGDMSRPFRSVRWRYHEGRANLIARSYVAGVRHGLIVVSLLNVSRFSIAANLAVNITSIPRS